MNIGLVIGGSIDQTSGGYRFDRQLVRHCRARGDDVTVISIPRRSTGRALLGGLSPLCRRRLNRPFDVLVQDELCHRSLVWHTSLSRPGAVVALVHLLHSHREDTRWPRLAAALERRYLRGVDAVVGTSHHTERAVGALTDAPSIVVPPAGRVEGAARSAAAVRDRARNGPLRVLFVGTIVPRKDPLTMLDALDRLAVDWEATIAGRQPDAAYADRVRDRIAALDRPGAVDLAGPVDDERLAGAFADAHVLAVPSRYESFGMVYLEAMEHGVVPIATRDGGAADIVAHGTNGLLVAPGDAVALAEHLETLATERDRLAQMGRAALTTAAAHPDWATSMARCRAFLARMAGSDSPPSVTGGPS